MSREIEIPHFVCRQIASPISILGFFFKRAASGIVFLFEFNFTRCLPLTPKVVVPLSQPKLFGSALVAPEKVERHDGRCFPFL